MKMEPESEITTIYKQWSFKLREYLRTLDLIDLCYDWLLRARLNLFLKKHAVDVSLKTIVSCHLKKISRRIYLSQKTREKLWKIVKKWEKLVTIRKILRHWKQHWREKALCRKIVAKWTSLIKNPYHKKNVMIHWKHFSTDRRRGRKTIKQWRKFMFRRFLQRRIINHWKSLVISTKLIPYDACIKFRFYAGKAWAWRHGTIVTVWIPTAYNMLESLHRQILTFFQNDRKTNSQDFQTISEMMDFDLTTFKNIGSSDGRIHVSVIRALNRHMLHYCMNAKIKKGLSKSSLLSFANTWDTLIVNLGSFFVVFGKCFTYLINSDTTIFDYWNQLVSTNNCQMIQAWDMCMQLVAKRDSRLPDIVFDYNKLQIKLRVLIQITSLETRNVHCLLCRKVFPIREYVSTDSLSSYCSKCRNKNPEKYDLQFNLERIFKQSFQLTR